MTDWENLFKVRLSNLVDESMDLHDVIKLLVVRNLLRKYRRRSWIKIYTEHSLVGLKPDVYFENIKDRSIICYEIQKKATPNYIKKKTKQYADYELPFMNSMDVIIIPIEKAPTDIFLLNKWLQDYLV